MTTLSQRLTALETRQADLERRIAELEKEAGCQFPWPTVPIPSSSDDARCSACHRLYRDMTHYVCTHPRCPSAVTRASFSAETPKHLIGTTAGAGGGWGSGEDGLLRYEDSVPKNR